MVNKVTVLFILHMHLGGPSNSLPTIYISRAVQAQGKGIMHILVVRGNSVFVKLYKIAMKPSGRIQRPSGRIQRSSGNVAIIAIYH